MDRRQIGSLIGVVILLSWVSVTFAETVSEEAQRYMARGMAAAEMAKTASDYALAAKEFEQAAKLAPDWPDIYYNIGSLQSKAGDITSAIKSFQRYLDLAPKSPDFAKVRDEIFKLEYRLEREKLATTLEGTWDGPNGQTFELKLDGSRLQLTRGRIGDDIVVSTVSGKDYTGTMADVPLVFSGTLVGDKISGQYLQAAVIAYVEVCQMPERKGIFAGTVDVAARQMRIVYNRVMLEYEWKFPTLFSDLSCRQTKWNDMPGYVLELNKQPLPGSASVPSLLTGAQSGDISGTVTDADGNVYQTVKIGNQVWTVENLRTTRYDDGSAIPLVTDSAAWAALTTPGYCYYNNTTNADNIKKFGALYNWHAVNTKKLAPKGWHVPTEAEWDTLQNYLIANGYNWDGTTTDNKIAKSMAAKTDWEIIRSTTPGGIDNDLSKNNRSGFSALPGGLRASVGSVSNFGNIGRGGWWWNATETDASRAYSRSLDSGLGTLVRFSRGGPKSSGFSVRLLRD